ncbi:effector-associated constant component EACC1 [Angustibacter sp. McL0619]|uniref:effector-associated constant component EACC1 n=1 Tax=Angustibacter sp. McL0619 TaxID=3415676 RepID=UPI003CEBA7B6
MGTHPSLLEVLVEPASTDFSPDDPGWRAQVIALRRGLQDADLDDVRREEIPSPGHKAGAESLIIALGTSGAITAAVEVIRAWLSRDRSRQLKLTFREGNREVSVEVDGTTVSDSAMTSALTSALERLPHGG